MKPPSRVKQSRSTENRPAAVNVHAVERGGNLSLIVPARQDAEIALLAQQVEHLADVFVVDVDSEPSPSPSTVVWTLGGAGAGVERRLRTRQPFAVNPTRPASAIARRRNRLLGIEQTWLNQPWAARAGTAGV